MGGCVSTPSDQNSGDVIAATNDYELVIRASKELESVLEVCLGAQGKGLHEKCSSVEHLLSKDLVRKIRYLATIRNKLVHEYGFNQIPDRERFIADFKVARQEMQAVLAKQGRQPPRRGGRSDICVVM